MVIYSRVIRPCYLASLLQIPINPFKTITLYNINRTAMEIDQSTASVVYTAIYVLTIVVLLFIMRRKYKKNWLRTEWKFGRGRMDIRILVGVIALLLMLVFRWTVSALPAA